MSARPAVVARVRKAGDDEASRARTGCAGDAAEDFEHLLHAALLAPHAEGPLAAQPGLAVYRNGFRRACIDALIANHPATSRLVGEDWLRSAAAEYLRHDLPTDASLLRYGEGLPDFLGGLPSTAEMPWLRAVCRLDRLWLDAHQAADAQPVHAGLLSTLPHDALGQLRLRPLPSARWAWHADAPAFAIWQAARAGAESADLAGLSWQPDGALLVRPGEAVEWHALDRAGCAFLDACADGQTLLDASARAVAADTGCAIATLIGQLLGWQALCLDPTCTHEP
ncbi:putative DNA-binding protein [Pseudacidovorax intermedius]|uniref:Putative DNA-binding protein n=1 Tax=Pseudacidovorax intermedius TaxID=433924 RepID=A0A370FGS5_9BURK|nr:DNA-binding domain-containing protein [Pseudacidovorax intermedius]RDI22854.1 putative DNA-binding protein [Pseudacidovorax intermedius]